MSGSSHSDIQHGLLFEHNPLPMLVYDRATLRIVAASNSALACYGYTREEFLAMTVHDLTPEDDRTGRPGAGPGQGPWPLDGTAEGGRSATAG